jgi:hypothetical protein
MIPHAAEPRQEDPPRRGLALGTYVGGIADPQIVELIGHSEFDAAL